MDVNYSKTIMDSLSGWEAQYHGLRLENSQDHRNVLLMEFWSAWPQAGRSAGVYPQRKSLWKNTGIEILQHCILDL